MPELPEVETIRIGLEKNLIGRTISEVELRLKKQFAGDPQLIINSKITSVRRFGKGLVIDFSNAFSLAIHVKMTGQLIIRESSFKNSTRKTLLASELVVSELPDKYTHVVFHLDNRAKLFYRDIRKFGWMKIVAKDKINDLPFFKALGFEPLKDLTFNLFSQILKNSKTPVKLALMDQSRIAGVGNIYANDALFISKINPERPSSSLSDSELKNLFNALEAVLKKGIEAGGASQWNYVDIHGGKGNYQNFFKVYNKAGKKCPDCDTLIIRFKMGGRGTFICPNCQK